MSEIDYLAWRAGQELRAAAHSPNERVRNIHLQFADSYSFKLKELKALQQRTKVAVEPV